MKIKVHKYGGKSLGNFCRVKKVCNRLIYYINKGYKIVVVVSAMGNCTEFIKNFLIKHKIFNLNKECDSILSIGEQISASILSIFLKKKKTKCDFLYPWQIPILTDGKFGDSNITKIYSKNIINFLKKNDIVIVPGFQGIDSKKNINVLKKGGSDITAIEISKCLKIKKCYIYTDVSGVFNLDPNKFKNVKRIKKIGYREMIELASSGSRVMNIESLYVGYLNKIRIYVLSSFHNYKFDKKNRTIIK
ncbi:amino acid kinase family protein [Candidatus Vidania fulgoroideorum]